jgi:hypothetical protein
MQTIPGRVSDPDPAFCLIADPDPGPGLYCEFLSNFC